MSEDYFSFTEPLVPEGRRVFALIRACELADAGTPAAEILATARAFEGWLKDGLKAEPRSGFVPGLTPALKRTRAPAAPADGGGEHSGAVEASQAIAQPINPTTVNPATVNTSTVARLPRR